MNPGTDIAAARQPRAYFPLAQCSILAPVPYALTCSTLLVLLPVFPPVSPLAVHSNFYDTLFILVDVASPLFVP